jgi:hypothetical protein
MKHLCIQNFRAIRADEALRKSVLPWFSRLNVGQRDVASLRPSLNGEGDILTSIV